MVIMQLFVFMSYRPIQAHVLSPFHNLYDGLHWCYAFLVLLGYTYSTSLHTLHWFLLIRYLTVLYFLNDVEEGGETAFPLADNTTFDATVRYDVLPLIESFSYECESYGTVPYWKSLIGWDAAARYDWFRNEAIWVSRYRRFLTHTKTFAEVTTDVRWLYNYSRYHWSVK